jgi:ribosome-associated protein
MVCVRENLNIPEGELSFTTSRSSGPGGQNVNKVNTRVTLLWNVAESPSISDEQRALLRERLAGRTNREGVLRVVSQRHRTQWANREAALRRFADLIADALSEATPRVQVTLPATANKRRLESKRRRGRLKRERAADLDYEE